ncbi:MAG: hypothetical protein ABL874_07040 [Sphingopyxis sp.]
MVEIGRLFSWPEALTVQAMLDAAGILCHVGGGLHGSAQIIPIALGGYRLTVPTVQYEDASAIIAVMLAKPATFSIDLRRRVLILLGVIAATIYVPAMILMGLEARGTAWWRIAFMPFDLAVTPVPLQGRGDYYLAVSYRA